MMRNATIVMASSSRSEPSVNIETEAK